MMIVPTPPPPVPIPRTGARRPVQPPPQSPAPPAPEPGREIDEIEGPLAQGPDVDPIALLGSVELNVQSSIVDGDAAIPAGGDAFDVLDHPLLEEASRGLHRRLLGRLDLLQRPVVH